MPELDFLTEKVRNYIILDTLLILLALVAFIYFIYFYFNKYKRYKKDNSNVKDELMLDIAYFCERGKRQRQEDSFYISPMDEFARNGVVVLVSDGMGGLKYGDDISKFVVDAIRDMHPVKFDDTDGNMAAIRMISKAVYDKYKLSGGATLAMVHLKEDMMHFYSVGDSNIILVRDGKATVLNPKQTYRTVMIKKLANQGKLTREAYYNLRSKALIDFIGNSNTRVYNTYTPLRIFDDDTIIVSSDGLTDALTVNMIPKLITGGARSTAERIKYGIRNRKLEKQDNYTGVVIKVDRSII